MDIADVVAALKEHRTRIDQAIAALEGLGSPGRRGRPSKAAATKGRHMSAAARKRISEAMKQRWAKQKGQVCSEKVCSREDEGPSNDERCGREEVVGLDESPSGCEEEARLALFPPPTMFYPDGRLNTRTFAVNTYTGSPC